MADLGRQHLLDVVLLSRSWELKVSRGWWIPASSCSMEKDDLMCLGCFWSCCARAAGLSVHLASEAPGMCHFAVACTHLPCSPEILGLLLTVTLHMFTGSFSGASQHPAARNLGKQILCREGRRRKSERQTESELYFLGSSVLPVTLSCPGSGVFKWDFKAGAVWHSSLGLMSLSSLGAQSGTRAGGDRRIDK